MPRVNHTTQHHPSLNICISQRSVPERSLITRCLPSFKLMVRRYWTFCSAEALWLSFNPAGNWQVESKRLSQCWMIIIIIMTILEWSTWRNTTLCFLCSSVFKTTLPLIKILTFGSCSSSGSKSLDSLGMSWERD